MRVQRCMADENKNKSVKEDPWGQIPNSMQGGEFRNENRHLVVRKFQNSFSCSIRIQNESFEEYFLVEVKEEEILQYGWRMFLKENRQLDRV